MQASKDKDQEISESEFLLEPLAPDESEEQNASIRCQYLVGVAAAVSKSVAQVVSIASLQLMSQIPPDFQLNALRFGVGVLFSLIYLFSKWVPPFILKENIKWLAIVSATTIIFNLTLYSHYLKRMPIVTVLCVHQTFNRIVLTLIFAKMFFNSNMSITKCVICLVTVVGTVLTVIPRVQMYLDLPVSELEQVSPDNSNGTSVQGKCTEILPNNTINYIHNYDTCSENEYYNNGDNDINPLMVAVGLILFVSISSTVEQTVISGTAIIHENTVIFSFWYFIIGTMFSLTVTFIFEHPFIPENTWDILLCFGHSVGASAVTYLDFVALQILEINVYTITSAIRLPLALVLQMTVLEGVVTVKHLYLLITGMTITILTSVTMPIYEYLFLKDKVKENN